MNSTTKHQVNKGRNFMIPTTPSNSLQKSWWGLRTLLALLLSLLASNSTATAQVGSWCSCGAGGGVEYWCPQEGWFDWQWDDILVKLEECLDADPSKDRDLEIRKFWWEYKDLFLHCTPDPISGLSYSWASADPDLGVPPFDWDRDNDNILTPEDFRRFFDDSIHCNAPDLIPPDFVPDFEFSPQDYLDLICVFLSHENSGQQNPAPYIVASRTLLTMFPEKFNRYPTGGELGQIISCGGGPGVPPPPTNCTDLTGDGQIMVDDVLLHFSLLDLDAGGDGSGSGFADPIGMLGDLFGTCGPTFSNPDYCNDLIIVSEDFLELPFPPDIRKDFLDDAGCTGDDPDFDPMEKLNLPEGEGDARDEPIYVSTDLPEVGAGSAAAPETSSTEENPCGPDASAGEGNPIAASPVSLPYGFKIESVTDAVVRLPGRDLNVIRTYNSKSDLYPDYAGNFQPGLVGARWTLNIFNYVDIDRAAPEPKPYMVTDLAEFYHLEQGIGGNWFTPGPTTQRMYDDKSIIIPNIDVGSTNYTVWRHEQPGQWTRDYYRWVLGGDIPVKYEGLLLQERDVYGNTWTYYYSELGTTNKSIRLTAVAINGYLTDDMFDRPEAAILLDWNLTGANTGRLNNLQVVRYLPSGLMMLTDSITYRYKEDGDLLTDDIGTEGDLIEVRQRNRVDLAELGADEWRDRFTQYRYHESGPTETNDDERLEVVGYDHQLKAVINAAQIEHFAEYLNRNRSYAARPAALRKATNDLLTRDDDYQWYDDGSKQLHVIDLPSKILSYYLNGDPTPRSHAVKYQYLQAGCDCAGAAPGIRQTYTYLDRLVGLDRTTIIDEHYGTDFAIQQKRVYFDLEYIGGSKGYYTTQHVIEETDANGGPTGRTWVWHYVYDTANRNLLQTFTPEAITSYTPAVPDGAPPSVGTNSASGLIYEYEYQDLGEPDDNRITNIGVRNGTADDLIPIQEITYRTDKPWLPSQIDKFTDPDSQADNLTQTRWL